MSEPKKTSEAETQTTNDIPTKLSPFLERICDSPVEDFRHRMLEEGTDTLKYAFRVAFFCSDIGYVVRQYEAEKGADYVNVDFDNHTAVLRLSKEEGDDFVLLVDMNYWTGLPYYVFGQRYENLMMYNTEPSLELRRQTEEFDKVLELIKRNMAKLEKDEPLGH